MRLLAISDLHVNHGTNREALEALPEHPTDWLLVPGDICERERDFVATLRLLTRRFAKVLWTPGNHELWTVPADSPSGVARYERLVQICRDHDVLTPEDPWVRWPGDGPPTVLALCFTLYDYTFAPDHIGPEGAVAWARADGIIAMDERLLEPHPYATRADWCRARLDETERRLAEVPPGYRIVLANHWPLRRDLTRIYAVPRYIPWCGSRRTEDWHRRFPIDVVVTGHLHMRATDWRDGVRFEEVALGYPRHWTQERGAEPYLRTILPAAVPPPESGWGGPTWHR